ncbi:polysaccharide pyruvyl transferase family protein [Nocardioides aequoreus]|uniref:polysaccharide pyruvyl transferase family protein n=1 Tax=Nocardioides aequoreus TaxID=397278 RepID=UPI0012F6C325|nr:polysaccharide pyruvyl transferase family protein [Nocardioides aequoreus]
MSMQRIFNYGSSLQAYGLRRLLEAADPEAQVSFVDYEPGRPLVQDGGSAPRSSFARAAQKVREVVEVDASWRDRLRFVDHKRRYGERYFGQIGITPEPNRDLDLDLQVVGSDEVFNCVQANTRVGYSRDLFGHGSPARGVVSYAASFGNTSLEKLQRFGIAEEVGTDLARFDALSVRDDNSASIVEALLGTRPPVHVDPVLAHPFMETEQAIPAGRLHERPYVIVYGYSGRLGRAENAAVREQAARHRADVLSFGGVQESADRFVECSPFELLAYFRDAEAVVTDTFHGTIFSMLNRRPFATIVRPSRGHAYGNEEKLMYLLRTFGLTAQRWDQGSDLQGVLEGDVDYDTVHRLVDDERGRTLEYLRAVTGKVGCVE